MWRQFETILATIWERWEDGWVGELVSCSSPTTTVRNSAEEESLLTHLF